MKAVLSKEATEAEELAVSAEDLRGVGERHSIMRRTGAATGVPIADLHAHLSDASRYDSGILWWDGVHLTPWGQELAARFLADALLGLIVPEDAEPRLAKDPTPLPKLSNAKWQPIPCRTLMNRRA